MADLGFDNKSYWKNRKAGLRGQAPFPSLIVGSDITPASSSRGMGLRKRRHATKVAKNQTLEYAETRKIIDARVQRQQTIAHTKSLDRLERRAREAAVR